MKQGPWLSVSPAWQPYANVSGAVVSVRQAKGLPHTINEAGDAAQGHLLRHHPNSLFALRRLTFTLDERGQFFFT